MLKISFRAMGCQIEAMTAYESGDAERLLRQVPVWFEEWEQVLSRFRPASELMQLNSRPDAPVAVSDTLAEVIENALKMEELSSGLVSPALLNSVIASGYDRTFELIGGLDSSIWPEPLTNLELKPQSFIFDRFAQTVTLPYGTGLDFGGTAKGWAAGRAAERLSITGPALVNAGGDVAACTGDDPDYTWTIAVHDPLERNGDLGALLLKNGGVATSGRDYRHWNQGGLERHHIIDPRTDQPAQTDVLSATVIAPNILEAEMAAKTAFILGSQEGLDWLEEHSQYAGLLVLQNGTPLSTKNYFKFQELKSWKALTH